jgi:hypothetical protein
MYNSSKVTVEEAERGCSAMAAHMVSVLDAAENDFLSIIVYDKSHSHQVCSTPSFVFSYSRGTFSCAKDLAGRQLHPDAVHRRQPGVV